MLGKNLLIGFGFLVLIAGACFPAPDPGKLGGVCVDVDLCDFGLVCERGHCVRGEYATGVGPLPDASSPTSDAATSFGGSGGASAGVGNGPSRGGSTSTGGANHGGGTSTGGAGASGSLDGGVGGTTSVSCVGIVAVQGQCNRNACLCAVTNECFPRGSASACCTEAPVCR